MMTTDQPARVSTSAAVAPPGPGPDDDGVDGHGVRDHLGVACSPGAGRRRRNRWPAHPDRVAVAAVLGRAVHPLAAVLVQERGERPVRPQARRLLLAVELQNSLPQGGQPAPVALLEPDDRPVELPLGQAPGALDPGAPGQLVEGTRRWNRREAGFAARGAPTSGPRPRSGAGRTGTRRAGCRCSRAPRKPAPRVVPVGRDHPVAHGGQDPVLGLGQPDGHGGQRSKAPSCLLTPLSG